MGSATVPRPARTTGTGASISRASSRTPEPPAEQERVDGYLLDLPGDTLLVNVKCHV